MSFLGEYQHNIDAKGRLIIPAKYRNQLGDKFVIVSWMDKSLRAMPLDIWNEMSEQLNALPKTNSKARALKRILFSSAGEYEFDKQGRIMLPMNVRDHAEISKSVIISGEGEAFNIWSEEVWMAYKQEAMENLDSLADDLDFDF